MMIGHSLLVVFLLSVATVNADQSENEDVSENLVSQDVKNVGIAVIGSGIGGASATHFLKYMFFFLDSL